jgi:hypothetical protein
VAHLALPCPQADPSAKPKEPLFPYAQKTVQRRQMHFVEHLLKIFSQKVWQLENFAYFCSVITKE